MKHYLATLLVCISITTMATEQQPKVTVYAVNKTGQDGFLYHSKHGSPGKGLKPVSKRIITHNEKASACLGTADSMKFCIIVKDADGNNVELQSRSISCKSIPDGTHYIIFRRHKNDIIMTRASGLDEQTKKKDNAQASSATHAAAPQQSSSTTNSSAGASINSSNV